MVIRYLFDRFDIPAERCDVWLHEPEDFIVRFSTPEDRNHVLRSGPGGALLPLIWWPWRRTSLANAASFQYRMLLGLQRVPLHARHAETAQRILGPSCTDVEVVRPDDVPPEDDRELFVTAWSLHPQLPHEEVEIFIPEPRLPESVQAATAVLSGLRYLVQIRLVSSEDLGDLQPPPADDGDDNADGGRDGAEHEDDPVQDGYDYWPTPRRDSDDDGSVDSNYNRCHPGINFPVCAGIVVGAITCPLDQHQLANATTVTLHTRTQDVEPWGDDHGCRPLSPVFVREVDPMILEFELHTPARHV